MSDTHTPNSFFRKKLRLTLFVLRHLSRAGASACWHALSHREIGYAALELSEQLPRDAAVVVDVGAHRGVVSEALHFLLQPRRLIAVEPNLEHHATLRARLGRYRSCELVTDALAEAPGNLVFHTHEFDAASSLYTCKPGHLEQFGFSGQHREVVVATTTLEALMNERQLPGIDLLKLDCQGAELRVLKGAGKRIDDIQAIFAEVSFEPIYEGAPLFPELHAWLSDRGFALRRMDNFAGANGRTQWADALYLRLPAR